MTAPPARAALLVPAGFAIAFVASLCGIGGGLFAVPLLHFGCGLTLRRAVASALALVLATTLCATVAEASKGEPDLSWPLVGALSLGVLVGVAAGHRLARRIGGRRLRQVFVVALALAGARVLLGPGDVDPAAGAASAGALELALAVLVGLGGGVATPLLGVGGGLVMVPGLFLGVPGLGFGVARACSLAAGAVGAARALSLAGRERAVSWPHGLPLALGAAAGATTGVFVLELPGWLAGARILLGLVLWGVALRFLAELRGFREPDQA